MTPTHAPTGSGAPTWTKFHVAQQGGRLAPRATIFAVSSNVTDPLRDVFVEEPIDFELGARILEDAPRIEEVDYPLGGPFGA